MNSDEAKKLVIRVINSVLDENIILSGDMTLIGAKSLLDSMKLVEVCLALEDMADDRGFEFDWTSDSTMSKSRSIFRTVQSLSDEFFSQFETKS